MTLHPPAVDLRELTDRELLSRTEHLARTERAATVRLLHHLNEIARRKLYLEVGFGSLHEYLTRGLRYSSPSACRRIQAARCIRDFPQVLPLLEAGELDLGTICLIERVITGENGEAILARVRGKSYRVVKRVVAEYGAPVVDVRERIDPVRTFVTPSDIDGVLFERQVARNVPYPHEPGAGSWVVSEQKLFVQFLASEGLIEKYEQVKALLSNRHPNAGFAEVLEALLDGFIARHSPQARKARREKRRAAAEGGKSSTVGVDGNRSRHIPADVRDEVFVRDGARCTYVAPDGTRCGSTHALQVDHIRPWAAGGTHDPDNLRLLCAAHNRLAAEQMLGRHLMERFWRRH